MVSDITDRFALTSIMFQIEIDTKPDLIVLDQIIRISAIKTDNENLDLIIEKAWFENYHFNTEMLGDKETLLDPNSLAAGLVFHTAVIERLQAMIADWRSIRARKYGKIAFRTRDYPTLADISVQVNLIRFV